MSDRREPLAMAPPRPALRAWLGLVIIGLGSATAALDTAVNIAFPSITNAFDLEVAGIQWVVIAYMLAHGSLLLMFGKLGDLVGYLRIFRVGLTLSAAAFLACAMAPSFGWLMAGRILQGVAAALVVSCTIALATSLFDERRRTIIIGVHGAMIALAAAFGPLVGGALVERWGWQVVFVGRLPLAVLALVLSVWLPSVRETRIARLDLIGSALLVTWISSMLLAFACLRFDPPVVVPATLGGVALVTFFGFVRRQHHAAEPIVRLVVFRDLRFSALHVASIVVNAAAFSVLLLVPFALVHIASLSARDGGLLLAVSLIGTITGSFVAPRLAMMLGGRNAVLLGMTVCATGLAVIAGPAIGASGMVLSLMMTGLLMQGLGHGIFQVAYTDLTVAALPVGDRGVAGSLSVVTRTVGIVSGAAGLSAIFHWSQAAALANGLASDLAFTNAFEQTLGLASAALFGSVLALAVMFRAARLRSAS